jgi:hypothetical protein
MTAGPAESFVFDAATYWEGSRALVLGNDWVQSGSLELRGVLTPVIFALPAAVSLWLGDLTGGTAVLVWNSLLVAVLGSVVIPLLAAKLGAVHRFTPVLSSVTTSGILAGFTPYPLMDLWAAAFAAVAILLLPSRNPYLIASAGMLFSMAVNIRPALLPIAILVAIAWASNRLRSSWIFAIGAAIAGIPQILLSSTRFGSFSISAPGTANLSAFQSSLASYVTRYDTIARAEAGGSPSQYFCSPTMASVVNTSGFPTSPLDLAWMLVSNPLESVPFVMQKFGATLLWSDMTPYEPGPVVGVSVLAIGVLFSVSVAIALLPLRIMKSDPPISPTPLILLAASLGSIATIALSASETRFGLPLVVFALPVIVYFFCQRRSGLTSRNRTSFIIIFTLSVVFSILLALAGIGGLDHPLPPGDGSLESCLSRAS